MMKALFKVKLIAARSKGDNSESLFVPDSLHRHIRHIGFHIEEM
jgi:hypothetical protein